MLIPKETPKEDIPTKRDSHSPPPYAPSDPSSSFSGSSPVHPSGLKPSNYVSLNQNHHSVRGSYLLDPSLEIPQEFLVPLPDGQSEERRSNLHASSEHGSVSTDIYLLDRPMAKSRKKILLTTSSTHGSVTTSIRRNGYLPAFDLKAESRNGYVSVKIPRTYRGMVTGTTKHGRVFMSDAVSAHSVIFSDVKGSKRMFFGDFSARNDDTDDAMVLESTHGSINIYFEDEDLTSPVVKSVKGFFGKMWN
ncbi:hypothetical protein D9757_004809 [Collybiopsis confluens]|uniref:DUF7330 domain-containing protein n=1 Tax=Collybiopsis confluens TaxID=2823264 RepID=A0A8H5HSE4_9AGAR|nr:hypothetical protein D9757_004809 [Collybiopsis confluens]